MSYQKLLREFISGRWGEHVGQGVLVRLGVRGDGDEFIGRLQSACHGDLAWSYWLLCDGVGLTPETIAKGCNLSVGECMEKIERVRKCAEAIYSFEDRYKNLDKIKKDTVVRYYAIHLTGLDEFDLKKAGLRKRQLTQNGNCV